MVCYVLFELGRKVYNNPGGANEAVIRMLISIGRSAIRKCDSGIYS
jgi:hypothetical protein